MNLPAQVFGDAAGGAGQIGVLAHGAAEFVRQAPETLLLFIVLERKCGDLSRCGSCGQQEGKT